MGAVRREVVEEERALLEERASFLMACSTNAEEAPSTRAFCRPGVPEEDSILLNR
jgi:hypothetical protein